MFMDFGLPSSSDEGEENDGEEAGEEEEDGVNSPAIGSYFLFNFILS
jgi:hypothetical protein